MKVKLLVNLTSYNPLFVEGAIGESNMKPYNRPDQPWRTYVDVKIDEQSLPVGIDGVECLDERYQKIKQLEKEIEQEELLSKLKNSQKIYYVVGPLGGSHGMYIKGKDQRQISSLVGREGCQEVLHLCEANSLEYEKILENDFYKLR